MFDNVGAVIKIFAAIILVIGILGSAIIGFTFVEDETMSGGIVVALGICASVVGSLLMYGFGQLVENSDKLVADNQRMNKVFEGNIKNGVKNPRSTICPGCKAELGFTDEQFKSGETLTCPMCGETVKL